MTDTEGRKTKEFSIEQIEKANRAASKEELPALAKAEGIELTEAEAEAFFGLLNGSRALSDEELTAVAGGKGSSSKPDPKYKLGQIVAKLYPDGFVESGPIIEIEAYDSKKGYCYTIKLPDFDCLAWLETDSSYAVFS